MANSKEFFTDYLILDAEKATLFDLIRVLYSNELEKRDFFNAPRERKLKGFGQRWIAFVSLLIQIILILLKKPMAFIGSNVERVLNYPYTNGGYLRLLWNILTGRVVKPDESSATFRSTIGLLDLRVDLDRKISEGDTRYNAALSIMAAKLSYENEAFCRAVVTDHWQMEFLNFYNFYNDYLREYATQAIIFQNIKANTIVVAFRGTEPYNADDWRTDVDISFYRLEADGLIKGRIHAGFMKALGLQKNGWPKEIDQDNQKPYAYYTIREKLTNLIKENENAKFIVTGHSLGGALAILFPAILILHEEKELLKKLKGVYTFGQPRVGDKEFGENMKEKLNDYNVGYYRYVYANDIVPRVPYDNNGTFYKHFGPARYYNSCYKGRVLEEEPNKNYFSIIWIIPKYLNAVYEIIRSFIIPWTRGFEYREGWFQKFFRSIGLIIPGLPNHGPQDYVNLTRLGTSLSSRHRINSTIHQQRVKDD